LSFELKKAGPVAVSLLDVEGRVLETLFSEKLPDGAHALRLDRPSELPAGLYWVRVETVDGVGVKAVFIGGL
jgi:hypothetical protein